MAELSRRRSGIWVPGSDGREVVADGSSLWFSSRSSSRWGWCSPSMPESLVHALVRGLSRSTASRSPAGAVFSAGGDPRSSVAFAGGGVCFLGDSGSRSMLGWSYTTFFRPAGVESRCCCCAALVGVFGCDCLLSSILSSFLPLSFFSAGDPRLLLLPAVVVVVVVLLLLLLLSNTLEISPPVLPVVCGVPGTPTPDDRCGGADEAAWFRWDRV